MGAWVIGHNLSGYLPETDTLAFPTPSEAIESFEIMAREYADRADDAVWEDWMAFDEEEAPVMLATVESILHDDGPDADTLRERGAYAIQVEDNDLRMITFWIAWEDTREPYDHEEW